MDGLSRRTVEAVRRMFSPDKFAEVENALLTYGEHDHEREVERVRLDIISISKGDVRRLAGWVKLAKRDYRDLIVSAEYESVNGKLRLKRHRPTNI
jgi:hypothetical protein